MKDPSRTIAKSRAIESLPEKARRGELTPDTAEAEALRLGLGDSGNGHHIKTE
jgi:hypothetical protein